MGFHVLRPEAPRQVGSSYWRILVIILYVCLQALIFAYISAGPEVVCSLTAGFCYIGAVRYIVNGRSCLIGTNSVSITSSKFARGFSVVDFVGIPH